MAPNSDLDITEPWRKDFHCKPYFGYEGEAERFVAEIPEALDNEDADKDCRSQSTACSGNLFSMAL